METQNEEEFRAQVSPFGGGMDWLEVRLPQVVPFRPRVQEAIATYRDGERCPFKSTPNYAAVVDLRHFDVADALLHLGKKGSGEQTHKVQMIGTGQYSMREHIAHLESIVDTNPMLLQPMRTDLTVDLPDVPLGWFMDRARVDRKRFSAQIGHVEDGGGFVLMGRREVETIYAGKRPNCFRVYNKTAERRAAYGRMVRGWHPPEPRFKEWCKRLAAAGARIDPEFEALCYERGLDPRLERPKLDIASDDLLPLFHATHEAWECKVSAKGPKPTFQQFCGMDESDLLTRFERQIGAQQIRKLHAENDAKKSPLFSSLRDLQKNLAEFNPFTAVTFSRPGPVDPSPLGDSSNAIITFMAGMYFRGLIQRDGRQLAEAWLHAQSNGNGKRLLERLEPFFPPDADGVHGISEAGLYERYREAITKQLAA
jgi:hypothetical protein